MFQILCAITHNCLALCLVFYSSAFLKSCNFDVGFLEQMSVPRSIFLNIAILVTCYLWNEKKGYKL